MLTGGTIREGILEILSANNGDFREVANFS